MDMEGLRALGIDTDEGLAYCADDVEFYGEMLEEYVREGTEKPAGFRRAYEARDWNGYRILAHSVKSTSRIVGAKALAERAARLEAAARAGDAEAIDGAHEAFLADYAGLVEAIRLALR